MPRPSPQEEWLLPDFCQVRLVFSAMVLAQLLALVLVLAALGKPGYRWEDLALVSLFLQWVALTNVALLCVLRPWLLRFSPYLAGALSYLLVLGVIGALSHLAWIYVIRPAPGVLPLGNLHYHVFLVHNLSIGAIVGGVALHYFYVHYQWRRHLQAATEARLQALQSRIRPHFLFNSLNTIASLTRLDPARAEQAVEDLAELFRASLADARECVPLGEELALCRHYLNIEALRLGERFRVEWQLDTLPQDALLPPLTLQPLLENALCYGIQPLPEGGVIRVTGLSDGRHIKIDVESPLPPPALRRKRQGQRIAQDNLRHRLQVFYGRHGRMEITQEGGIYRVSLRFPYEAHRT